MAPPPPDRVRGCSWSQLPTRLLGTCHFQHSPEHLAPELKYFSSAYNGTFMLMLWKGRLSGGGPGPAAPNPSMSLYRITRECKTCAFCWPMCLWPSPPQWCLLVIEPFAWQWYLMWSEHGRKVELFHLTGGKHPLWGWGQITSSAHDWMASFSVGHKCPWTGRPCELMALWLYGHNVYRSQKHCWMGSSFASWWLVTE